MLFLIFFSLVSDFPKRNNQTQFRKNVKYKIKAKRRIEQAKEKVKNNIGGKAEYWRGQGATYQNGKRYGY